ncbi:MAG: hypothetical protein ACI8S6_005485 [Myxococcota bacterium]|jgi:hypothetical protein
MSDDIQQEWERACSVIHDWFQSQGADPTAHRFQEPEDQRGTAMCWGISSGSVDAFILLNRGEEDVSLQIYSPVLRLPDPSQRAGFFEALLRLNATTLSACAFGIDEDDEVVVISDRQADGLSVRELDELIRSVTTYADHFNDNLADRFGAELIGEE